MADGPAAHLSIPQPLSQVCCACPPRCAAQGQLPALEQAVCLQAGRARVLAEVALTQEPCSGSPAGRWLFFSYFEQGIEC